MISAVPERICSAAIITALRPEPHILLIVVAGTACGIPAPSAAWRAGACPRLAGRTHPMITSWMSPGATPEACTAAWAAALPSLTALSGVSAPRKAPMGVRLADTMTTSGADMVAASRSSAGDAHPAPQRLAGCDLGGAAWTQAPLEYGDECRGDLGRSQRLVLTIPVGDPVESTGERERAHLRVARLDRAVLDAFADQPADTLVDLGLQRLDVAAHGRGEVLVLGAHHAPGEIGRHRLPVVAQHGVEALARRQLEILHLAEGRADRLDAGEEALEQQVFLVGDVVVDRGLGDVQRRGDVVERGVVVALTVEGAGGGADHGLTLDLPVPPACPPRRGARGGRLARRGRTWAAAVHGCAEYYSGA